MPPSKNYFYNKQGLWSLYLMCAFPLLFWTLLLAFRDVSWLTERTNLWDAIGDVSYGMFYAFVESLIWFIVLTALGFLVSRKWSIERRVALLGVLFLITALWSMLDQLYHLTGRWTPLPILRAIAYTGRPVFTMYLIALGLTSLSFMLPAYFILHSDKALKNVQDFMERLSTLTMFYLFLSFVGLIIVVIRNL
jgi:hypothetical protein